ncbi:MAG TPA: hypothetical protein VK585_04630 [Jiangellaceae bacterium]|nr:hypothetical protein [Jiangellaceae bacterium]
MSRVDETLQALVLRDAPGATGRKGAGFHRARRIRRRVIGCDAGEQPQRNHGSYGHSRQRSAMRPVLLSAMPSRRVLDGYVHVDDSHVVDPPDRTIR